MSFEATVVDVLLGSAADTLGERDLVEDRINEWTAVHGRQQRLILRPIRWEAAVPAYGDSPQSIINRDLVDECDAMIAVFRLRVGDGTLAEVERLHSLGKPVQMYFYAGDWPSDVEAEALRRFREFRESVRPKALFAEYATEAELGEAVSRNIATLQYTHSMQHSAGGDARSHPERLQISREAFKIGRRAVAELRALVSPIQRSTGDGEEDRRRFEAKIQTTAEFLNAYHQLVQGERPFFDPRDWAVLEQLDTQLRKVWNLGVIGRNLTGWTHRVEMADNLAEKALGECLSAVEELVRRLLVR